MANTNPQPASSGILKRGDRYLLVKRKNPPSADMYAFPGGRGEPGETPAQTAVREFVEETGIEVHSPALFKTYDLVHRDESGVITSHFFLSVFQVQETGLTEAIAADDADSLGWFTIDEILLLNAPDSVKDCVMHLTGLVKSGS